MVNKQIRKSAMSLTALLMGILIVIFVFTAMFSWWNINSESASLTIDTKYAETQANLTDAQTDLQTNINDIKVNLDAIREAESGFATAWNGLKGLGNTLRLPVTFITTTLKTWTAIDYSLDLVPGYIKTLVLLALTVVVVLIVLSKLMGDTNL